MKRVLVILAIVAVAAAAGGVYLVRQAVAGIAPAELEARYLTDADRFVNVDGARVRVRTEGPADAPVIVLIHGFTFSLESWDAWAADLSRDHRVVRYDLLGHGLTGPDPKQRYAVPERAAFLGQLLDAVGVEHATIGGNSLGGAIAWRYAAAHPERVDKLILVDAAVFAFNDVTDEPVEPPAAMKAFLTLAPEAGVDQMSTLIYVDRSALPENRLALTRDLMRRRGNGDAFIAHIREFTMPDPTAELAKITAPTLILWGGSDYVIPSAHAARVSAAIAGSRAVVYDGVGHAPHEEAPARTVADVRTFLAE